MERTSHPVLPPDDDFKLPLDRSGASWRFGLAGVLFALCLLQVLPEAEGPILIRTRTSGHRSPWWCSSPKRSRCSSRGSVFDAVGPRICSSACFRSSPSSGCCFSGSPWMPANWSAAP